MLQVHDRFGPTAAAPIVLNLCMIAAAVLGGSLGVKSAEWHIGLVAASVVVAGLLQVVQYALMAVPANLELGVGKTLSPRDLDRLGGPIESQLSTRTARLLRAMNNHFEGLILFTIAVVVVTLGEKTSALTAACACINSSDPSPSNSMM